MIVPGFPAQTSYPVLLYRVGFWSRSQFPPSSPLSGVVSTHGSLVSYQSRTNYKSIEIVVSVLSPPHLLVLFVVSDGPVSPHINYLLGR